MAKPNGQIDRRRFLFAEKCREWQYSIQVSALFFFALFRKRSRFKLEICILVLFFSVLIQPSWPHTWSITHISQIRRYTQVYPAIFYEKVSKSRLPFLISTVHVGSLCVVHMRCLVTLWHDWIYLFICPRESSAYNVVEYRKPHMYALQIYFQPFLERVFTSDGVVVGVVRALMT